jgi:hypothetical protein
MLAVPQAKVGGNCATIVFKQTLGSLGAGRGRHECRRHIACRAKCEVIFATALSVPFAVPSAYALGYILSSYGLGPAKIVAGCEEFEEV